jgi:hypothetical protein
VAALGLVLANCTTTSTKAILNDAKAPQASRTARVLLMPADIELSELTAAGIKEPKAAWTRSAQSHVRTALTRVLAEKNAKLVPAGRLAHSDTQLIKLHGAVGRTILRHKYVAQLQLPTKRGKFDWTLGRDVRKLRKRYNADYALFVLLRDSYSTGGRKALAVMGAIFGVGVSTGYQVGFASLVDLRSGEIVWFNRLFSNTGDLRELEPAQVAVRNLLDKVPL